MAQKKCQILTCERKVIPGNPHELCHADTELLERFMVFVPFVLNMMEKAGAEAAEGVEESPVEEETPELVVPKEPELIVIK